MKRNKAFEQLGVKLTNPQWSWSGRTAEGEVVLTFWQDRFYRGPQGQMLYKFPALTVNRQDRLGAAELLQNIQHAIDHHDGIVGAVISRAKDLNADPRVIASSFPARHKMRIVEFNSQTGAFVAEQL